MAQILYMIDRIPASARWTECFACGTVFPAVMPLSHQLAECIKCGALCTAGNYYVKPKGDLNE